MPVTFTYQVVNRNFNDPVYRVKAVRRRESTAVGLVVKNEYKGTWEATTDLHGTSSWKRGFLTRKDAAEYLYGRKNA